MEKKRKKIISVLIFIALGLLALAVSTYLFINQPKKSTASRKAKFTVTAQQLLSEFESGEEAANAKYLDKVVLVEGTVSTVDAENGRTTIMLDTGNPLGRISCELSADESAKGVTLKENDTAKIKGICTGILMDVVLVDCVIVNE
jgi:hypothetical protein